MRKRKIPILPVYVFVSVAKSDNDWHDKATDSLVNFEIVKYFTSEKYEMQKFTASIQKFQTGNVSGFLCAV
jgi:ABC-type transport system involved in Fe-S cluster assembly fused permease/ATPase subunit